MAQSSPERVAHDFFAAIEGRRWREAAALVDPEQLGPYREEMLAMLVGWAQHREELRRPRKGSGALVELSFDGKLDSALARFADTPIPAVPGVRTLRDLAALPPAEFMARLLEASDLRSDDRIMRAGDAFPRRILGAVADGDSVAHVLYRGDGPGVRPDDPYHVEVLAVVRRAGRWYVRRSRSNQAFGSPAFLLTRLGELETRRE